MPQVDHTVDHGTLRQALTIQKRVVGALILREIKTRFWKNKMGYFWVVIEPSLHIIVLFFVLTYVRGQTQSSNGMKPMETIASGVVPFFVFRTVASFIASSILAN